MNKKTLFTISLASALISSGAYANSTNNSVQASEHMGASVAHTLVAANQATAGVAAVPFKVVGHLADASNTVGDALLEMSDQNYVLNVSDETLVAGANPGQAITQNAQKGHTS